MKSFCFTLFCYFTQLTSESPSLTPKRRYPLRRIVQMATNIPSSRSSTIADENMDDKVDPVPYENGHKHSTERPTLERIGSQNKETEANIYPEPEAVAEADLEKTGVVPKSVAPPGGVNPADFPEREDSKPGLWSWEAGVACSSALAGSTALVSFKSTIKRICSGATRQVRFLGFPL